MSEFRDLEFLPRYEMNETEKVAHAEIMEGMIDSYFDHKEEHILPPTKMRVLVIEKSLGDQLQESLDRCPGEGLPPSIQRAQSKAIGENQ